MGALKPGTTYIYERNGAKIYAREAGQTERQLIGYTYGNEPDYKDKVNWTSILEASNTNASLRDALDRVIMLYELSKENDG